MADAKLYLVRGDQSSSRRMLGRALWSLAVFALGFVVGLALHKMRGH